MAVLIRAGVPGLTAAGHETIVPADGRASFTLAELQAFVGGYIEAVYVDDAVMFVNEDGKRLGLPLNPVATVLGRAAGIAPGDRIVGDVVVCSRLEAGADALGVTDEAPEDDHGCEHGYARGCCRACDPDGGT